MESKKMYLDKYDMMQRFNCCESKAMMIIRCIKSVSDTLKLKGKVTTTDFDCWYNKRNRTANEEQSRSDQNVVG